MIDDSKHITHASQWDLKYQRLKKTQKGHLCFQSSGLVTGLKLQCANTDKLFISIHESRFWTPHLPENGTSRSFTNYTVLHSVCPRVPETLWTGKPLLLQKWLQRGRMLLGKRMRVRHSAQRGKRGSASNNNQFSKWFLSSFFLGEAITSEASIWTRLGASVEQIEVKIILVWDISAHLSYFMFFWKHQVLS